MTLFSIPHEAIPLFQRDQHSSNPRPFREPLAGPFLTSAITNRKSAIDILRLEVESNVECRLLIADS
jgi:hypothetical protein